MEPVAEEADELPHPERPERAVLGEADVGVPQRPRKDAAPRFPQAAGRTGRGRGRRDRHARGRSTQEDRPLQADGVRQAG